MTKKKLSLINIDISPLIYWLVSSSSRRGLIWGKVGGLGVSLFQPARSIILLEYMKIYCNIRCNYISIKCIKILNTKILILMKHVIMLKIKVLIFIAKNQPGT